MIMKLRQLLEEQDRQIEEFVISQRCLEHIEVLQRHSLAYG
jgi:hypothetical protein